MCVSPNNNQVGFTHYLVNPVHDRLMSSYYKDPLAFYIYENHQEYIA